MKTAIVGLVSLLIGAILGGFLALGFGTGMGAASGLVVGSQAGACLAVETARTQGLLSSEEIDRVIAATVDKLREKTRNVPEQANIEWIETGAECERMIAEMDQAPPTTR